MKVRKCGGDKKCKRAKKCYRARKHFRHHVVSHKLRKKLQEFVIEEEEHLKNQNVQKEKLDLHVEE